MKPGNQEAAAMDMDELGFFLYMEEQERRQKEDEQEESSGEGQED